PDQKASVGVLGLARQDLVSDDDDAGALQDLHPSTGTRPGKARGPLKRMLDQRRLPWHILVLGDASAGEWPSAKTHAYFAPPSCSPWALAQAAARAAPAPTRTRARAAPAAPAVRPPAPA